MGIREGEELFIHQARFANVESKYQEATSKHSKLGMPLTVGERARELREYGAWLRLRESTSKAREYSRCFQKEPASHTFGMGEGLTLPGKCPFPPSGSCVCTFEWALASVLINFTDLKMQIVPLL